MGTCFGAPCDDGGMSLAGLEFAHSCSGRTGWVSLCKRGRWGAAGHVVLHAHRENRIKPLALFPYERAPPVAPDAIPCLLKLSPLLLLLLLLLLLPLLLLLLLPFSAVSSWRCRSFRRSWPSTRRSSASSRIRYIEPDPVCVVFAVGRRVDLGARLFFFGVPAIDHVVSGQWVPIQKLVVSPAHTVNPFELPPRPG